MAGVSEQEAMIAGSKPMPYFSHDSTAHEDIKCRLLILRGGMEYYGLWWMLCELLAGADNHRLPYETEEHKQLMAIMLQVEPDKASTFIGCCAELGLIDKELCERGVIVSDRMLRNSAVFGRNRANGKRGGKKAATTQA